MSCATNRVASRLCAVARRALLAHAAAGCRIFPTVSGGRSPGTHRPLPVVENDQSALESKRGKWFCVQPAVLLWYFNYRNIGPRITGPRFGLPFGVG